MPVKSTYNFVPAPKESEVFKPDWAHQVNHDIPFSDGESGEIELKITAQTPIFIRNGHSKEDAKAFNDYLAEKKKNPNVLPTKEVQGRIDNYLMFSNINGQYFIPGTSLKGMFRNVLEILTFSRLNKNLVNDARYSFRDLSRGSLYMKSYETNKVRGGWLKEKLDGRWIVEECNSIYHIHHTEVDKAVKTKFRQDFLNNTPNDKSAKFKYKECKVSLAINFSIVEDENEKPKAIYNKDSNLQGTLVFTGQSSKRKENSGTRPSGKVHEFVFLDNEIPSIIEVSEKQQKDFKFIYLDHDKNNISDDWDFWREKLEKGIKVPVFFNKIGDSLKHFGLAYMYKLPFEKSIHEMTPINKYSDVIDLAELLFGNTEKKKSLKGRVIFGHATSNNAEPFMEPQKEILGSPKASYFPFYLEQNNNIQLNGYNSYQKINTLKGYKRYPIHSKTWTGNYDSTQLESFKIFSYFIPLKSGAEFKMKIRFHNLRKVEIGSLFSAITFHNNLDACFHSLGSAKSFGFGKVKVELMDFKYMKHQLNDYLLAFEDVMGSRWFENSTIKELLVMASNDRDETLVYPDLTEFVEYKNESQFLPNYSTINTKSFRSFKERIQVQEHELRKKIDDEDRKKNEDEENKLVERLRNTENLLGLTDFINKFPYNTNVEEFKIKIQNLHKTNKVEQAKEMEKIDLSFTTYKFENIKNTLNNIFKRNKAFSFSEKQADQIINALKICFSEDNKAFYRKKSLAKLNEFPWTDIKRWLGESKAKALYDELNNKP